MSESHPWHSADAQPASGHVISCTPSGSGTALEPVARARCAPRGRARGIRGDGLDSRRRHSCKADHRHRDHERRQDNGGDQLLQASRTSSPSLSQTIFEAISGQDFRVVRGLPAHSERLTEEARRQNPRSHSFLLSRCGRRRAHRHLTTRKSRPRAPLLFPASPFGDHSFRNHTRECAKSISPKGPAPGRGGAGLHIRGTVTRKAPRRLSGEGAGT